MRELRTFLLAHPRASIPTVRSANKKLKGIADGPTVTDYGLITLKSDISSDSGKVFYHMDFRIPDADMGAFDSVNSDEILRLAA
jgi:hypothetical protein